MANRLLDAVSPYLRQHSGNPVDWWPWCGEAFQQARERDVPVLLSVGYAACHWCHVMAHESFEDQATAQFMNAHFVNIKVDREERPDIDAIYMAATTALTGSGGWPMTVLLDHDARAFFAGTYFPKRPRPGMPAFLQVLTALSQAWQTRRSDVLAAATEIDHELRQREDAAITAGTTTLGRADIRAAVAMLTEDFDPRHGGFGGAPKFPPSMVLEFLMRADRVLADAGTPDPQLRIIAAQTLAAMARGGMFDQLGGGFARYSVDEAWVVPHFEKMLYDNALLLRTYLHWWRMTGDQLAERVARQTAEFLLRELGTEQGGFAASLDADSPVADPAGPAVEGAFYVWTRLELEAELGPIDADWVAELCGVTPAGTFDNGASVLQLRHDPGDPQRWERARQALLRARELRPRPARDDKIVAEWNGLAIGALAEAGVLLAEPNWLTAAQRAAELLLDVHWDPESRRLGRVSLGGRPGDAAAVLADYTSSAEGVLALYQCTGQGRWLAFAQDLLAVAVAQFTDGSGGFYETPAHGPKLVRRPRSLTDGVTPSGWSALASALTTLAALTGADGLGEQAESAVARLAPLAHEAPRYTGWVWATACALLAGPWQVGIVTARGQLQDDACAALLQVAVGSSSPGLVVAMGQAGQPGPQLLEHREAIGGQPTAYLCRDFTCELPTTDPAALRARLASSAPQG